mgnify:CR=1 FL=1
MVLCGWLISQKRNKEKRNMALGREWELYQGETLLREEDKKVERD